MEHTEQTVRARMKTQCWSHEIYDGRSRLEFDAGKIAVAGDIALLKMAANAEPIVRGLQWQADRFSCLQFENSQTAGARGDEHVNDSVLAASVSKNLSVGKTLIERSVNARDVL